MVLKSCQRPGLCWRGSILCIGAGFPCQDLLAEQVPKFQPPVIYCSAIIDLLANVDLSYLGSPKPQKATNASFLSCS